jgi:starvation-inducible DNA-binding protein
MAAFRGAADPRTVAGHLLRRHDRDPGAGILDHRSRAASHRQSPRRVMHYSATTTRNDVMKNTTSRSRDAVRVRNAPLATPTDLSSAATKDIAGALNALLADVFALYMKTKNFHWHMSGPHFRDYHLLLDEQADQIYAISDPIAERVRKLGGETIKSIGHIARLQRVLDNDADYVEPSDMLAELRDDNKTLASRMREAHNVCEEHRDVATASLIEIWIDEAERRTWFLFEASREGDASGH